MARQRSTTVAILSDDPVVGSALRLLLEGVDYPTRILREPSATGSATDAREQLEGVDLLLLTPSLREEDREGFLEALGAAPTTVEVPILTLSTAPRKSWSAERVRYPGPYPSRISAERSRRPWRRGNHTGGRGSRTSENPLSTK